MSFFLPNPKDAILAARNVTMRFGGIVAVSDMSVCLPKGSICGIIGPNGAGKTTMFNILSGFYTPTEGEVLFEGVSVRGLKPNQICRLGIARTFQNIRLSTQMSVLENVMVGCHVRRHCSWWMAPLGLPSYYREERSLREKAVRLVERVGLTASLNEQAGSLPMEHSADLKLRVRWPLSHISFCLMSPPQG